jgi:hypothetical protein
LFVDLSNIQIGARRQADQEGEWRTDVRVEGENLARYLHAGRAVVRGAVVVNADLPAAARHHYAGIGQVIVRESGRVTGTEQANDETLQVRIYETIHSLPKGVLVLATGDGAGSAEGRGFIPALDAARRHGWAIEVVSWRNSTNSRLIAWLKRTGNLFVALEEAYYSVTFIQGGRKAQSMSLKHRATVSPR